MNEVVPGAVRELIRERVQALEQLEILLLVHADAQRAWSADELAAQLSLSTILVESALAHLLHHRFLAIVHGPRYRYSASDEATGAMVDELARAYEHSRAEVLGLISSDALGRVRRRMRVLIDKIASEGSEPRKK